MPQQLIPGTESPLRQVEHRETKPALPWFGDAFMPRWTYTRTEIWIEGERTRFQAERQRFEHGHLVSEHFEGSGDAVELWRTAAQMQQQLLETVRLWMTPWSMFLPRSRERD